MRAGTMNYTASRKSGFTMVELLIAIIIIGILVTIIVPVLSNRAADARLAAAQADMEALANAQSQVAIDTGYIVRLHVLNDSGAAPDVPAAGSDDINDVNDTIRDEDLNNGGNPDQIFLDAKTGEFMQNNLFQRIDTDGGPEKFGWKGPYVNFQRKLDPATPFAAGYDWSYGSPLDPWGTPYFLFAPGESGTSGGIDSGGVVDENLGDINPTFNYGGIAPVDATNFDRMTVLSLGPNALPGDGTGTAILGTGDDLVRSF